jgi:hypothetical protein
MRTPDPDRLHHSGKARRFHPEPAVEERLNASPLASAGVTRQLRPPIREMFRRTAQMATKRPNTRQTRGLFDLTPPIPRESDS